MCFTLALRVPAHAAPVVLGVCLMTRSHLINRVVLNDSANLFTFTSDVVERRSTVMWVWWDAELGDRAVYAVTEFGDSQWEWESPSDTTDEALATYSWVVLLFSRLHRDTAVSCLTNVTLITSDSSTTLYDYWRQASPTVRRRPTTPAVRVVVAVSYAVSTTRPPRALAAYRRYIFWVTFSVLYCASKTWSLLGPVSDSLDTALSLIHRILSSGDFTVYSWTLLFAPVILSIFHMLLYMCY